MKKLIICGLAFLAISAQSVSAQNKGDKFVGGMLGVGVSSSFYLNNTPSTAISCNVAPEFGFFVANRFKIGGVVDYSLSISEGNLISHCLTVGPNLSYYVRLCDKFYYTPSFEICFLYAHAYKNHISVDGFGFGLGLSVVGFEFRPTSHFGMSVNLLSVDYVYEYVDRDYSANNLTFKLGVNPTVGVKYYF